MSFFLRACSLVLLLGGLGACARRSVSLAPLAPRSTASQSTATSSASLSLPRQLPNQLVAPLPVPVTELGSAVTVYSPEEVVQDIYERAYQELSKMLDERYPLSFKRAVFLTENAYLDCSTPQ